MSFRVLVIPEDPTHNGYILRPLMGQLLDLAGKPRAHIQVLTSPRVQGYLPAVHAIRTELRNRYRHFDLWVFVPDADRGSSAGSLEGELSEHGIRLMVCPAVPELEAWLLAGYREHLDLPWDAVRKHPRLKEEVFEPFLKKHGDPREPGSGRGRLMRESVRNWRALISACPELDRLLERLREVTI